MKYWIYICITILITSCTEKHHSYTDEQIQKFESDFKLHVTQKNEMWKSGKSSPLLDSDKPGFQGLHYYDYDPNFRFEGPIHKYENPDTFIIYGSKKNDERPSLKYGYFDFVFNEQKYTLQIYKIIRSNPEYQDYLFLGFTDGTTGKETYGAGRYIDLKINAENHYVIDFNFAYNPYCAYNPKYSCAIPPRENHLDLAIKAGEKNYHD